MSAPTSPHNKRKQLACKVMLLDDTVQTYYVPTKSVGKALYDEVVYKLQLLEADYFDIAYTDVQGVTSWLDHEKPIVRQLPHHSLDFRFVVKFYSPDPGLLEEEYTRYLFALQVKRDLANGAMPCQEHTAVLLASFIVQGMFGDFSEEEFAVPGYLKSVKLLPLQNDEIEIKIAEHHKEHFGQSPSDADFNLLETARKVELYGIQMHPAKDHEAVSLHLAVAHMGVLVFQNMTKINTFSWAKIRKLSFKRKKFLIKLHPEGYGYYKDTVEFYFDSRNECKNFWKKCLEHHAFFRCHSVKRLPRNRTRVVSRGSSFRYSGRTQKQLVEYVRENYVKRPPFQRSTSMRTMSAGATPRTGTLNSRDLHLSQNTSMSSASHLVTPAPGGSDRSSATITPAPGGDRRRSPSAAGGHEANGTMERNRLAVEREERQRNEEEDEKHEDEEETSAVAAASSAEPPRTGSPSNGSQREAIDMSQFILLRKRNCSSPEALAAGYAGSDLENKNKLSRSEDVEDIPKHMLKLKRDSINSQPRNLLHSQSSTVPDHHGSGDLNHVGLGLQGSEAGSQRLARLRHADAEDLDRSEESELNLTAAAAAAALELRSEHMHSPGASSPRSPGRPVIFEVDESNDNQMEGSRHLHGNTSIEYRQPQQPLSRQPVSPQFSNYNSDSLRHRTRIASDESGTTSSLTTVTYTSSGSIASAKTEGAMVLQKKKMKPGKAYYIGKELVMTERTYVKDLSVISVWFRNAVSQGNFPVSRNVTESLLESFDGLYEFHCRFLKQLEQRLSLWESQEISGVVNQEQCRIGDLILDNLTVLQKYEEYMNDSESLLKNLDSCCKEDRVFEQVYRDFEMQKVCYLPLNTFLLKPLHRLLHYHLIVDRFLQFYPNSHPDVADLLSSSNQLNALIEMFAGQLPFLDNLQKLLELQQDLIGLNNLLQPNREFIREGCLQKLSRKGYQQRMFFLFSDVLLYTSRLATQSLLFRVHGQLPISGMTVEETDNKIAVSNSFAVYSGSRCLLVAASSESEKAKWMEDIQRAILAAGSSSSSSSDKNQERAVLYPSLKSNNSSEATDDAFEDQINLAAIDRGQILHRTNTLMHVCWHRNTSVSMKERSMANRKLLSGFLLRKFKTNNDWQRLWVVFTNFCLFFYKSYRDDFPLASLPLLGYSVQTPAPTDNIKEELCFKLQFKNHIYFFRAESQYTFERWMEVISAATGTSHHMRLFSRLDSEASVPMTTGRHRDF